MLKDNVGNFFNQQGIVSGAIRDWYNSSEDQGLKKAQEDALEKQKKEAENAKSSTISEFFGTMKGYGTKIDPTLTRADRLVGQVLGLKGQLPEIFKEVEISYYLLRRLLGVKTQDGAKQAKVSKLSKGETLMVNIGSTSTGGKVVKVLEGDRGETSARIALTQPVCTQESEKIALSRRVDKHWRLIGWGEIKKGVKVGAAESC